MHAGRLVALAVRTEGGLRCLEPGVGSVGEQDVRAIQVVCCCGWRSRRYVAGQECAWTEVDGLQISAAWSAAALQVWRQHCEEDVGPFLAALPFPGHSENAR
jgi:hypothetical protein